MPKAKKKCPLNKKLGDAAEKAVISKLRNQGYTQIRVVQNRSGHGVDIIAYNPKKNIVMCVEVKANSSPLSKAQLKGGYWFVRNRLSKATKGKGHWKIPPNKKKLKTDAEDAKEWIRSADEVEYSIYRVDVNPKTLETTIPKGEPSVW